MEQKQSNTELAIKRVTLYTSGVGYFERSGEVDGEQRRTLYFPVDQINDVLKSLTLFDPGKGAVNPVTYAAQDPMDKALQAFSVDVSDNPSRATLLNRIRGAEIALEIADGAGKMIAGIVMGVEKMPTALPNGLGTTTAQYVNILTDSGVRTVDLATVDAVHLKDEKLAAEIRQALATVAKGRDASKRPLTLAFSGEGTRRVDVAYLVEAPVWQTTYRLVLGDKPRLQGWALVQNTGQDDWTDAQLTLVSGQPISFRQDLYTPLYLTRPLVAPRLDKLQTPYRYDSELAVSGAAPASAAPAGAVSKRSRSEPKYDRGGDIDFAPEEKARGIMLGSLSADWMEQSIETTGAELGTALFAYRIDVPVSVPRQESAMIPFVSSEIEAETVSVYNETARSANPLLGARLKNSTGLHLMGGPLTIFASTPGGETGYTGDALIDDTEPDQKRLITYAVDLAVDGAVDRTVGVDVIQTIKIVHGRLDAAYKQEHRTVYRFKNHDDKDRIVVVEHPVRGSEYKLIEPSEAAETTADHHRFDVPLAAGQSLEFEVRQDRTHWSGLGLGHAKSGVLLVFAGYGICSDPVREALEIAAQKRTELDKVEVAVLNLDKEDEAIAGGQERIRKNMEKLDQKSDLYRRYVADLTEQEDTIRTLRRDAAAKREELGRLQAEFNDYIANLKPD